LPRHFALDLQLLEGLWILQTFPALIFGLYTGWFRAQGLIAGWVAGFSSGIWLAWTNDFKPLHTPHFGSASVTLYSGLLALGANILVCHSGQRYVPAFFAWKPRAGTLTERQFSSCLSVQRIAPRRA
jgi:Na+/proline symporter